MEWVSILANLGGKIFDRIFPDPDKANEAKLKLFEMQQNGELAKLAADTDLAKAAAGIVLAEAQSKNWLASSWRPITMLIFVALIVARWFGWTAPGLSQPEVLELWAIVKIGMGGYVIGRSVEKVVPDVVAAMRLK
jgi:hypothetical protein